MIFHLAAAAAIRRHSFTADSQEALGKLRRSSSAYSHGNVSGSIPEDQEYTRGSGFRSNSLRGDSGRGLVRSATTSSRHPSSSSSSNNRISAQASRSTASLNRTVSTSSHDGKAGHRPRGSQTVSERVYNPDRTMSLTTTTVRTYGSFQLVSTKTTPIKPPPTKSKQKSSVHRQKGAGSLQRPAPKYAPSLLSMESDLDSVLEEDYIPSHSAHNFTLPSISDDSIGTTLTPPRSHHHNPHISFSPVTSIDEESERHRPPPRSLSPIKSALKSDHSRNGSVGSNINYEDGGVYLAPPNSAKRQSKVSFSSNDAINEYNSQHPPSVSAAANLPQSPAHAAALGAAGSSQVIHPSQERTVTGARYTYDSSTHAVSKRSSTSSVGLPIKATSSHAATKTKTTSAAATKPTSRGVHPTSPSPLSPPKRHSTAKPPAAKSRAYVKKSASHNESYINEDDDDSSSGHSIYSDASDYPMQLVGPNTPGGHNTHVVYSNPTKNNPKSRVPPAPSRAQLQQQSAAQQRADKKQQAANRAHDQKSKFAAATAAAQKHTQKPESIEPTLTAATAARRSSVRVSNGMAIPPSTLPQDTRIKKKKDQSSLESRQAALATAKNHAPAATGTVKRTPSKTSKQPQQTAQTATPKPVNVNTAVIAPASSEPLYGDADRLEQPELLENEHSGSLSHSYRALAGYRDSDFHDDTEEFDDEYDILHPGQIDANGYPIEAIDASPSRGEYDDLAREQTAPETVAITVPEPEDESILPHVAQLPDLQGTYDHQELHHDISDNEDVDLKSPVSGEQNFTEHTGETFESFPDLDEPQIPKYGIENNEVSYGTPRGIGQSDDELDANLEQSAPRTPSANISSLNGINGEALPAVMLLDGMSVIASSTPNGSSHFEHLSSSTELDDELPDDLTPPSQVQRSLRTKSSSSSLTAIRENMIETPSSPVPPTTKKIEQQVLQPALQTGFVAKPQQQQNAHPARQQSTHRQPQGQQGLRSNRPVNQQGAYPSVQNGNTQQRPPRPLSQQAKPASTPQGQRPPQSKPRPQSFQAGTASQKQQHQRARPQSQLPPQNKSRAQQLYPDVYKPASQTTQNKPKPVSTFDPGFPALAPTLSDSSFDEDRARRRKEREAKGPGFRLLSLRSSRPQNEENFGSILGSPSLSAPGRTMSLTLTSSQSSNGGGFAAAQGPPQDSSRFKSRIADDSDSDYEGMVNETFSSLKKKNIGRRGSNSGGAGLLSSLRSNKLQTHESPIGNNLSVTNSASGPEAYPVTSNGSAGYAGSVSLPTSPRVGDRFDGASPNSLLSSPSRTNTGGSHWDGAQPPSPEQKKRSPIGVLFARRQHIVDMQQQRIRERKEQRDPSRTYSITGDPHNVLSHPIAEVPTTPNVGNGSFAAVTPSPKYQPVSSPDTGVIGRHASQAEAQAKNDPLVGAAFNHVANTTGTVDTAGGMATQAAGQQLAQDIPAVKKKRFGALRKVFKREK